MSGTTNVSTNYPGDIGKYIEQKTLPLARRQLCAFQFATPATLDKGYGTTYTATRFNRLNLPNAPLAEGVPPLGEALTISQVTGTTQQWGDSVVITDVAELTIFHPLFKMAIERCALQIAETDERNAYLTLMGGAQVNYVNQRGARASLQAGDVLDVHTINRSVASLMQIGAPRFMGDEVTDKQVNAMDGGGRASQNPRLHEHYVAIISPLCMGDLRENNTITLAWSYSDINRLYNYEVGEWSGVTFCASNMVPYFTGAAAVSGATGATGGSLTAGTTYYTQVTAMQPITGYEQVIYQIDGGTAPGGSNTALSLTLPSTAGYLYNVYIGTSSTVEGNLAATTTTGIGSPTTGPFAGQAWGLNPGSTVLLTAIGNALTPPAAPATGITVYPTFVFGRDYYSMINLDSTRMTYLKDADKSDPLNQKRVVGWKKFYGMLITNQQFGMRIESSSAFTAGFG